MSGKLFFYIEYELYFTVGMDGNFQQNDDSIITELTLNSYQKECSDIAMNDTDLPFSTKNENILLPSYSSENCKYYNVTTKFLHFYK